MSQKIVATSDLIKWCDEQVAQGKKLSMAWEGGGDSGWVYFKIDEEQVSDSAETDEISQLTDLMYDQLDYGSWAGEFSASGEAIYNSEEKAFVGTDYYSEDETYPYECSLQIRVPKRLWFDSIEYNFEQEDPVIDIAFIVRNGFLTDEHTQVAEQVKVSLNDQVQKAINDYSSLPESTPYENIWQNDRINRSEFVEDGDYLVATIDELSIGTRSETEKDIYLELINQEDEQD
jgi:hypothetical protein